MEEDSCIQCLVRNPRPWVDDSFNLCKQDVHLLERKDTVADYATQVLFNQGDARFPHTTPMWRLQWSKVPFYSSFLTRLLHWLHCDFFLHILIHFIITHLAPTKFLPLSLKIAEHFLRRAIKRRKAAKNIQYVGQLIRCCVVCWSISDICVASRTRFLAPTTQYCWRNLTNNTDTPGRRFRSCWSSIIKVVILCFLGRIKGCWIVLSSSEWRMRHPTLRCPSSSNYGESFITC